MMVRVERNAGTDSSADVQLVAMVREELKKKLLVTPDIEIVDYSSLPRSERKTKRVFDNREA